MENERANIPREEVAEIRKRLEEAGGKGDIKDIALDVEVKSMLEKMSRVYSNVDFIPVKGDKIGTVGEIKRDAENAGLEFVDEIFLPAVGPEKSLEEALKGMLGNPDYVIHFCDDMMLIFRRSGGEKEEEAEA